MTREIKECKKFLASITKTKDNAMDILLLSQACEADEARQQCYDVLRQVNMNQLKQHRLFTALDRQSRQGVLLLKVNDLQQCMNEALQQMLGLISRLLYVMSREKPNVMSQEKPKRQSTNQGPLHVCTKHTRQSSSYSTMQAILNCDSCKATWVQLATGFSGSHYNCDEIHLNNDIVKVIEKMVDLMPQ
jgi:hypothetical protein